MWFFCGKKARYFRAYILADCDGDYRKHDYYEAETKEHC